MQTIARSSFTTVKTEGGLLPADVLQRIADSRNLPGLRPEDYHLLPGERLNEAVNRAWNRCLGAWLNFAEQRQKLSANDTGTSLTRERWLLVLFQELGFGRLPSLRGGLTAPDGTSYPISHLWEQTPIHLVTFRQLLDRKSEVATQVKRSPHSLMQEFLNRSSDHQWGIIANGLQLRLLRDNASLRRAAYVEFDLEVMMTGELYAEFTLLWLVCHQSRFEQRSEIENAEGTQTDADNAQSDVDEDQIPSVSDPRPLRSLTCWLERWSKQAANHGTRALDALRDGVQEAIEALGSGFLDHRANEALRRRLRSGELTTNDYYRQLRRLAYRLIFLAVAEDRDLLLLPQADAVTRQRYLNHYSIRHLREMAAKVRGGPHPDLYQQLRLLFEKLREGYAPLGIPGLGSFLFSDQSTPALDDLELANQSLLTAIRAIAFTVENGVRRPVDYRNLDSEEPGSVYESLLELHPQINVDAASFSLQQGAGSERKTTGSHYTPSSLVESLLDTALEPVVADRLAQVEAQWRKHNDRESTALRALQEAALLALKVLDFATGSGHMLIGAGRRLAKHLARIRTGDDEPTPEALRTSMREVVRHCLYGVDVNETAVELCKVALWMETLEPGKPLSFLDAHIQCGNSLIGVTPGLDISEIPDEAFQPVTGDDKITASALRKRNKREREGQLSLPFQVTVIETLEDLARWRVAQLAQLDELDEEGVAQVQLKERAYSKYLTSDEYAQSRLEADLWTAAFFWPMPVGAGETQPAPTHQVLRQVRTGQPIDAELQRQVQALAKRHQFFHWALTFPEVFNSKTSGFDVVLSNPPWERIKLQEKEWFAPRNPAIAEASNAAARKRMIEALKTEDSALYLAFQQDQRSAESEGHFIRNSANYPLCGRGDVNTYAIFAELACQVISRQGRAGVIVPSGIATDDTTKFFFQDVMETGALVSLYDFENRLGIFPGVHRSYKFCLLTLQGTATNSTKIRKDAEFVFFALDVADLQDKERRFTLTAEEITLLNPNTKTCPIFRGRRDAQINKRIYQSIPILVRDDGTNSDTWNAYYMRLVHLGDHADELRLMWQEGNSSWNIPLYESKMIHGFDHRFATFDGVQKADMIAGKQRLVKPETKADPCTFIGSRYLVTQSLTNKLFAKYESYHFEWFIVWRDIARATDERTSIVAIIPKLPASITCPALGFSTDTSGALLVANLNSFVFDYLARLNTGGIHLNWGVVKQLPVLAPSIYKTTSLFALCNGKTELSKWFIPYVLELSYTAWDLQPFARDCGYDGPPFRWDKERRFLLRCELDAAYFHLYGITRDDVDYIMDTFPIVKRKDIQKHGDYRTKRVILEIYDAMAEAMRTGVAYQTRLDPPPADPRVAHSARTES